MNTSTEAPDELTLADDPGFGPAPLYVKIKRLILHKIACGDWPPEQRIPSENELVRELRVSRMTVHRALSELTREGVLVRTQGVGTFVAPSKPESSLLEIRNIADDIRQRGHVHSCDMVLAREEIAGPRVSRDLGVTGGAPVYHSICIHREDGVPVQLEDRYVNPAAAPAYLEQDFTRITPTQFLNSVIPSPELRHVIEAIAADEEIGRRLDIEIGAPCLQMTRTTWLGDLPITFVRLYHPGSRYRLSGSIPAAQR